MGFWAVFRSFVHMGLIGFGGPVANIGLLQDLVVNRRRWMTAEEFMTGLSLCEMLPGPTATELAMYCGYRMAGARGALGAGLAFILPAFLLILALSHLYFTLGQVPGAAELLRWVKPVVIAVIGWATYRLGQTAIRRVPQALLAAVSFGLYLLWHPNILILMGGALLLGLVALRPKRLP